MATPTPSSTTTPNPPILALTEQRLADPSVLKQMHQMMDDVVGEDQFSEAHHFVRNLIAYFTKYPDFAKKYPDAHHDYQEMIVNAKFIALPLLGEEMVVDLLAHHYADQFQIEAYDLERKIHGRMLAIILHQERDVLKKRIMQALEKCAQPLTSIRPLYQGQPRESTVANWIRDYNVFVGTGEMVDAVKQTDYLYRSNNARRLSGSERDRLQKLVHLYEKMKRSSLTPEGIEDLIIQEVNDRLILFSEGQFETLTGSSAPIPVGSVQDDAVKSSEAESKFSQLQKKYLALLDQLDPIIEREKVLYDQTRGNVPLVLDALWKGLGASESDTVLASLFILAKSAALDALLSGGEKRFINLLRPYLEKNYDEQVLRNFDEEPIAPAFVVALLHVILRAKLGLSESDSAITAIQLGEMAFQVGGYQYYGMSYGDAETQKFVWHKLALDQRGYLIVSRVQRIACVQKANELPYEEKWSRMLPSVMVTSSAKGKGGRLNEFGREFLNALEREDLKSLVQTSEEVQKRLSGPNILADIRAHAEEVRAGRIPGVESSKAALIAEFVRTIEQLRELQ
jgi:hypothetical protein